MSVSLSGLQRTFGPTELPPGFGADWSLQIAIPNQNVGWSWKLNVPPVPFWVGG